MTMRVGAQIILQQWIAGFGVTMLMVQLGFMGGWPSPTLARLTAPDSPLPLTLDQASWVAALVNVGRFFGAILGSILASTIGSKRTIFVTLWPLALGWLFIYAANSVEWLYAARLFLGAGLGMTFSSFPIYVGEVSIPEIRGALVSLMSVGGASGTVISSTLGSIMSLDTTSSIYFGISVPLMLLFFWLPESPHHLMKIGNRKGAEKSIHWYRNGHEVAKELEAVEKFVGDCSKQSFIDKLREFKTPSVRNATLQVIALFTFMQICGLNSIAFYMESILRSAKFNLFNPATVVIWVSGTTILSAAVSLVLIDRCGRKFLLVVSSAGTCLSMLGLSSHFFMMKMGIDTNTPDMQLLPMISMFLFMNAFYFGLMSVPSTVLSETFPANIKCIASCICSLTGAVTSFLSAKTYQPMVDTIGERYVFLSYAIFSFIVIPYTIFFIRETKGKTLTEIQEDFRGK